MNYNRHITLTCKQNHYGGHLFYDGLRLKRFDTLCSNTMSKYHILKIQSILNNNEYGLNMLHCRALVSSKN